MTVSVAPHRPYPAAARQLTLDELLLSDAETGPTTLHNGFSETLANQLALAEAFNKHLFRPNTYLHKWWARRCGSTCRAILKQFAANLHQRDYYAPGGLHGKIVLNPMMGGGTTLHEALRQRRRQRSHERRQQFHDYSGWHLPGMCACPQAGRRPHGLYVKESRLLDYP